MWLRSDREHAAPELAVELQRGIVRSGGGRRKEEGGRRKKGGRLT